MKACQCTDWTLGEGGPRTPSPSSHFPNNTEESNLGCNTNEWSFQWDEQRWYKPWDHYEMGFWQLK